MTVRLGLVTALLCASTGTARAADDAEAEEPDAPMLDAPAYTPLMAAWSQVQDDLDREAWAEAAGRQPRLVALREELGLPNLPAHSAVLLHAAEKSAAGGGVDAAERLAEAAAALSPDLAGPRLDKAGYIFRRTPFAVADHLRELRAGLERLAVDLDAGMSATANAITGAIWVLVALTALFAVAMLARYGRFAANDLRRLLPRGVTSFQAAVLLGVLLVAPFFGGLGLLLTVSLWLVVTSLYQGTTERIASFALLAAVGALPFATAAVVRATHWPATPEAVVNRCNLGPCWEGDREQIHSWANHHVLPYETNYTMALVEARIAGSHRGPVNDARNYASVTRDTERTPQALTLLGNLAYFEALWECRAEEQGAPGAAARVEDRLEDALDHWQEAVALDPRSLPALYNLHVALLQLGRTEEGGEMLDRAMDVDTARVIRWNDQVARERNLLRCRSPDRGNLHVMHPRVPPSRLARAAMSRDVPRDALVIPFGGLWTSRIGTRGVGGAGFAGSALVLLLSLLGAALRPSRSCARCGGVSDPRTRLDIDEGAICERCLLIDVRRAFIDAKDKWFREKEREVDLRRRSRRTRWITWVLPGFGHLLRGAALRGLVYFGLVFGCILGAWMIHIVTHDPGRPLGITSGRLLVFGAVAGITWLVAVIDAYAGGVEP